MSRSPFTATEAAGLTVEQREFRNTLRRFLAKEAPPPAVRSCMETDDGFSAELWEQLCNEMALPGLAVPEDLGGQGFGIAEVAIVAEELGRALTPTPYFASGILTARAVTHAPAGRARDELLSEIARGTTATLAWVEPHGSFDLDAVCMTRDEESGTVTGTKTFVLDGHSADRLLVIVRGGPEGRLQLVAVDPSAPEVTRRRLQTLDRTRRLATVDFHRAPTIEIDPSARDALAATLAEAAAVLCAESVGGFGAVVEAAVAFARERTQFGRAIGSFQAIKHKLADLWILFEGSRTATDEAIASLVRGEARAPFVASIAKSYVADAYRDAAFENIQIHGGSGFTWEVDAHLYLRRAQFNADFLGSPAFHRERVALELETIHP
ncbi:MAG: acyl-CoA/acyl-ACP dehydrogenase [Candidatus Binatia bacterium]|nr:acyl-CoA/acyl-ACP dehydrogenase [Candidatus Binatia bacterium]